MIWSNNTTTGAWPLQGVLSAAQRERLRHWTFVDGHTTVRERARRKESRKGRKRAPRKSRKQQAAARVARPRQPTESEGALIASMMIAACGWQLLQCHMHALPKQRTLSRHSRDARHCRILACDTHGMPAPGCNLRGAYDIAFAMRLGVGTTPGHTGRVMDLLLSSLA